MNTQTQLHQQPVRFLGRYLTVLAFTAVAFSPSLTFGAGLKQATVTEIRNDVRRRDAAGDERKAVVQDTVKGDELLRTGIKSMAELEFDDKTIARMASNSIFSFKENTRDMELKSGLMLFHVPKGAGGAKIATPAATAAITGTTGLVEAPENKTLTKWILLEGSANIPAGKETVKVLPGEMLIVYATGKWIKAPVDLSVLFKTSSFLQGVKEKIKKFDTEDRIEKILNEQQIELENGELVPLGFFIAGEGDKLLQQGGGADGPTLADLLSGAVAVIAVLPTDFDSGFGAGQEANAHGGQQAGNAGGGFVNVGLTGSVRGQLVWNNNADLDLHLILPNSGGQVSFANRNIAFNGGLATAALDKDNTGGIIDLAPTSRVENIVVNGTVPSGNYEFFVFNFNNRGLPPTDATLRITGDNGAHVQTINLTIDHRLQSANFTVTVP